MHHAGLDDQSHGGACDIFSISSMLEVFPFLSVGAFEATAWLT
jgi:hypothetical protein